MELRKKLLGLLVVPPDEERTPEQIVDWLLEQQYRCADCGEDRPANVFAWRRVKAASRGFRRFGVAPQGYCRSHQSIRNGASQKERLKKPEAKEKRRAWDRANWTRYRARRYAEFRRYYARNRARLLANYAQWAADNPEKRKASQDAYRERKRQRSRSLGRPVAVHTMTMRDPDTRD